MAAPWRAGNPVAWLVSTGRFKAIDRLRRDGRFTRIDDHTDIVDRIPDSALGHDEKETIED